MLRDGKMWLGIKAAATNTYSSDREATVLRSSLCMGAVSCICAGCASFPGIGCCRLPCVGCGHASNPDRHLIPLVLSP